MESSTCTLLFQIKLAAPSSGMCALHRPLGQNLSHLPTTVKRSVKRHRLARNALFGPSLRTRSVVKMLPLQVTVVLPTRPSGTRSLNRVAFGERPSGRNGRSICDTCVVRPCAVLPSQELEDTVKLTDGVCDFNVPYGLRSLKATRLRAVWFGDGLGLHRPPATHHFPL